MTFDVLVSVNAQKLSLSHVQASCASVSAIYFSLT